MQNESKSVRTWSEVAGSEQFRALGPDHQERARELYYQDNVAPRVPKGMEQRARALFDQDTLGSSQQSSLDDENYDYSAGVVDFPAQGGIEAMDFAKEAGGGALTGTGAMISGAGDLVRPSPQERTPAETPNGEFTPLSARIGSLTDPVTNAIANAIDAPARAVGEWLSGKGKAISDSKTDAAKEALKASTPTGDIDSPSTWSMGEDPSVAGYGLHLANLAGQFGPQAGAMIATKGRSIQTPAMMGIGGLQAGGSAGDEVEQRITETLDADLQASSGLYQKLRQTMPEQEARKSLIETARSAAFDGAAPVGALGGLATQVALGPLQRSIGGSVGRKLAAGTLIEAPLEGVQEVAETTEARRSTNKSIEENRSLTEGTFGDFALGALGGAGFSVAGTALSGKDANPQTAVDEQDATFENTPAPLAIDGPGLQGLPQPGQVFYGDSQGGMQDIGPIKSVDGVMQPTPQSQQWVNPNNRTDAQASLIGGEGMEAQTPRGAPAGLQGQFIPSQEQQSMTPPANMGLMLDGNIERLGLPEPEAFVVDSEGNTQRGATSPQVFNEPPMKGGAGMDQQAPTAPPKQQKSAPKAMPDEKSPQERAQYSWDSMNTFERNKAAQDTLGYSDADMTEAAAKAWDQLAEQDQQKLADAMDQDSGQRWDAPNQKISDKDRPVLQNRDRSTDASITQMQDIKNNPDYDRLSVSRDFGNGAPVVEPGADFPATQLGRSERTTTSTGRKIPVQYAVVEADQLLPSNDALGNSIPEYANGVEGKSRAIAGNGRVAGITAAWKSSKPVKAEAYKKQMIEDTQHGIDPKVIRAMKQPVLVRIMPLSEVSNNIGDESNVSGQAGLSPTEQANTDMRRIDLAELSLTEDNELSENTVLDFIKGMPKSELGTLLTKSGRPTPAAYARAEAALFQQAYQNEALTENLVDLKGDAKFIMNALMRAAPAMAKLEGAGIYDIRPLVSEAAEVAVNARRQGIKLSEFIKMGDFGRNPQVMPILEMMIESGQRTTAIGDKLINLAQMAYTEANKAGQDMFGEVDKQSPEALMKKAFDGEKANAQEIDGTPETLGDDGRSRPDASNAEGRAADGEGQSDSGAVQADQPAKPEAEQAKVKPWGDRSFTLNMDDEYGPALPHREAYEAAKSAPSGSVTHGLTVRPSGKQWHNLYLSHDGGDFSSISVGKDMPSNVADLIEQGFSDYDKKQKKQEQATKDKDAVSAKEAAIAKENNLVLGRELGTIIPNTGKQFKSAKIITDHGDGTFTLRGVQGNKQAELRGLSASSIVRAVDRYNLNAGTESEAWRKNYLLAKKRATELGLDPKEHGKLPGLVKAIDAFNAEPVASQPNQPGKYRKLDSEGAVTDGAGIKKGEQFLTSSGRLTTPYPSKVAEKHSAEWLIDNATQEAESRGDDFNASIFKNTTTLKNGTLTDSDRESMNEYLFGQQPEVLRKTLKDIESSAPALDLAQQTEETLAAEAERLEQLQKEEAAQKAKQKDSESKARERDADKARADEVVDDFQLGQPAEEVMSGMGDIFDTQQTEVKPSKADADPEAGLEQDAPIPAGDWRTQIGGNNFRNNKDGITVRKDDRVIHIRGANSISASKKALELATQDIRELHHAAAKENPSDPFSEATIWLDGNGDMIRKKGTKKIIGALAGVLKQSPVKTDASKKSEAKPKDDKKADKARTELSTEAKEYAAVLRRNANDFNGIYKGASLKPVAIDFAEHAIENGNRMTDAELQGLADKHSVPLDIIRQLSSNHFTYEGLAFAVEQKIPEARALRSEAREIKANKKAVQTKPAEAIEDFGEKIGGARKDAWNGFKDDLNKISDDQIASQSLSKIWPEPNYSAMIESGESPITVALIRALREEITSKPRVKYKLTRWAESVREARSTANALLDGTLAADQFLSELRKSGTTLEGFAGRVELYSLVGHEKSLAKIYFAKHRYSLYRGEKDVTLWVVENNNTSGTFGGWPSQIATGKTKEQAIEAFKKAYSDMPEKGDKKAKQSFDIWSERGREGYLVGKKIGRHYAEFAGPFKTTKEAREYVINSEKELTDKLEKYREIPSERRDTERPRIGEDHRKGQDVSPDLFAEEFGFRGVEFGNWVEQGRRQADLNHAYDALMDMAAVLDVPAKAISLNGALSLAFGARGKGGKDAAKAHYEPGKVVINLSKRTGAGSLGHEWWHALDNYFSRERDSRTDYMTTERDVNLSSRSSNYHYADKRVRKEMVDAFGEVVKRINETALEARSRMLDNKRTKEYWTTTEEMSARAFESYLISKLQDNNAHNDYLANIVDESTWEAAEALGFEMDGSYPYPTAGEIPAIRAGFDHFFNTIESRETDSGVQLYKTSSKEGATGVEAQAITDAIANMPELAGVKVVQSFEDLPARALKQAEIDGVNPGDLNGIYVNGTSYVVADNHATVAEAVRTAVHEEVGHLGIRGLLGDKLTPTMERIYSSMAATASGRKLIKDIRADYGHLRDKDQRQAVAEELIAHLLETGDKPTLVQRFVSKVRELLRAMFPQVKWTNLDVLALGEQSRAWLRRGMKSEKSEKSSAGNNGDFDGTNPDIRYSLKSKKNKHTSESFNDLTDKQKAALNKIAPLTTQQKAAEWFRDKTDRALLKIRQGLVDRFAALRELDEAAHGEDILNTDITNSSWVLARMSSAASGALHAMLNNGRIYLDQKQKVIDIQDGDALGLGATLARLGSPAEIERFMGWIAGNRSARLAAEGRENLFSADDIDALKTLNNGKTDSGKTRKALYDDVFKEFQQYRDDVLAIAEQTGIITAENRALWRDEFYVPFYRVMDEDAKAGGPGGTKGLTRQEAYKKLKGGKQNLNDLLQNTMLNFNHLLTASLKNQAAAQALSNAEQIGVAEKTTEAARDKKASTFVLVDGKQQWYNIDDPMVFEALSMIGDGGLNTSAVKVMSFFKRTFTNMTTITPQFIIANLLRDSMQATATSPVSMNFMKNILTGGKDWSDGKKRARMMATGGAFSFGHIYNNDPHEMKAHLTRDLKSAQLLSSTKLIPEALKAGWDAWNAAANAAENANRAAIFSQNEKSKGKLAAAFEARDLMDFSMHGAWPAVRFLIRVIPFLNARLQGLDKLHRSGVKPTLLTAFGKGNASDKQAMKRFITVVGAISAASMALMLVNNDDEEYRKLEEWQKDTYWFVRFGGKAFFIPKPFEVGVIATMAERLLQQGIDDKATGELFKQRLGHAITQTFAFSVVPHALQPVLDIYSNMDAFTDRPIESMGMDRLSKGLRARADTTAPAHALSSATRVFGDDFPLAVSPVQADHLIKGYLGQVGAWGAGLVDTMWRTAKGETQPARHWHEYQPIRRFYKDLDTPNAYTRYSTLFYEGLRESGKVYADVMELQKLGKEDQMRETINKNRDMLGMRKNLNRAQRDLSKINARIGMIRIGGLDAEEKRREIDRLTVIKSRITEAAGKQVEAMKAAR